MVKNTQFAMLTLHTQNPKVFDRNLNDEILFINGIWL